MQRIEGWSVVAGDRLCGEVLGRLGHQQSRRMLTNPVLEVRLMGDGTWPGSYLVAFTDSGHPYRLGRPCARFGAPAARAFIHARLQRHAPEGACCGACAAGEPSCDADRLEVTLDTTFHEVEYIELYESSFNAF